MPRTILVVDENRDFHELMGAIVRWAHLPVEIRCAGDSQAAFAMAKQERPDLIVIGDLYPDASRPELCQHLRACAVTATIPILVLAADPWLARDQDLPACADAVLGKASDLDAIVRTIAQLLAAPR